MPNASNSAVALARASSAVGTPVGGSGSATVQDVSSTMESTGIVSTGTAVPTTADGVVSAGFISGSATAHPAPMETATAVGALKYQLCIASLPTDTVGVE